MEETKEVTIEGPTPIWEILLTWGMLAGMVGGAIAAALWARRRRREVHESGTYNAEGAEAMINPPG